MDNLWVNNFRSLATNVCYWVHISPFDEDELVIQWNRDVARIFNLEAILFSCAIPCENVCVEVFSNGSILHVDFSAVCEVGILCSANRIELLNAHNC